MMSDSRKRVSQSDTPHTNCCAKELTIGVPLSERMRFETQAVDNIIANKLATTSSTDLLLLPRPSNITFYSSKDPDMTLRR